MTLNKARIQQQLEVIELVEASKLTNGHQLSMSYTEAGDFGRLVDDRVLLDLSDYGNSCGQWSGTVAQLKLFLDTLKRRGYTPK